MWLPHVGLEEYFNKNGVKGLTDYIDHHHKIIVDYKFGDRTLSSTRSQDIWKRILVTKFTLFIQKEAFIACQPRIQWSACQPDMIELQPCPIQGYLFV
jgi:hypothetical protein